MQNLAFVDTETTGLDPRRHDAWEIAVIVRRTGRPDIERLWQIRTSLTGADPKALEINRYNQRFAVPAGEFAAQLPTESTDVTLPLTEQQLMTDLMGTLDRAVLVGSNPAFDAAFLTKLLHQAGLTPRWHYRTVDIATLAAGHLYGRAAQLARHTADASWYDKIADGIEFPWKSYEVSEAVGVPRPTADAAHTALGDARWVRDVWDEIAVPGAFYTASDEQLAAMAADALRDLHGGAA